MKWDNLLNSSRFGEPPENINSDSRSQFQRDYDRIIFSPEFRKLQSKTQIFPLPENIFAHNRLTHSLEVASVGRSIAHLVCNEIIKTETCDKLLLAEIPTIVSTACLVHDIGNPPFGHSGESTISSYFKTGEGKNIKNNDFSQQEWIDLCNFEGNANVLRLLTNQFAGRRQGGFALTYATLGSMIKYPKPSSEGYKKYGYFNTEQATFLSIVEHCGMKNGEKISRHPLVYIVEAADDISYLIMDIEDAYRLNIISAETVEKYLLPFISFDDTILNRFTQQCSTLSKNEKIGYLRSLVINTLVKTCAQIFLDNYETIMNGELPSSLVSYLPTHIKPLLDNCKRLGFEKIYSDTGVVSIEISGYKVLSTLMHNFCSAVFSPDKKYSELLLKTIPYMYKPSGTPYEKIRLINDYISSMTDLEALKLYREMMGIDIPQRVFTGK